jgi:hypothetical protein
MAATTAMIVGLGILACASLYIGSTSNRVLTTIIGYGMFMIECLMILGLLLAGEKGTSLIPLIEVNLTVLAIVFFFVALVKLFLFMLGFFAWGGTGQGKWETDAKW